MCACKEARSSWLRSGLKRKREGGSPSSQCTVSGIRRRRCCRILLGCKFNGLGCLRRRKNCELCAKKKRGGGIYSGKNVMLFFRLDEREREGPARHTHLLHQLRKASNSVLQKKGTHICLPFYPRVNSHHLQLATAHPSNPSPSHSHLKQQLHSCGGRNSSASPNYSSLSTHSLFERICPLLFQPFSSVHCIASRLRIPLKVPPPSISSSSFLILIWEGEIAF